MTSDASQLARVREKAEAELLPVSDSRLRRLCGARRAHERLLGLLLVLRHLEHASDRLEYLALARPLVGDPDDDCRWHAVKIVRHFVEQDADTVLEIALEHGASDDETVRVTVATGLLERVLEHHYDRAFPLLEERVEQGDANLADTLRRCWLFGGAKAHSREVDRLLHKVARGGPASTTRRGRE